MIEKELAWFERERLLIEMDLRRRFPFVEKSFKNESNFFQKEFKIDTNSQERPLNIESRLIERPFKFESSLLRFDEDEFPRVVENGSSIEMNVAVPEDIDPSKINVTCKDGVLIIEAENKIERPNSVSRVEFYKRTTLPPNTDFKSLKCHLKNNNRLSLQARLNSVDTRPVRSIPIEIKY